MYISPVLCLGSYIFSVYVDESTLTRKMKTHLMYMIIWLTYIRVVF